MNADVLQRKYYKNLMFTQVTLENEYSHYDLSDIVQNRMVGEISHQIAAKQFVSRYCDSTRGQQYIGKLYVFTEEELLDSVRHYEQEIDTLRSIRKMRVNK